MGGQDFDFLLKTFDFFFLFPRSLDYFDEKKWEKHGKRARKEQGGKRLTRRWKRLLVMYGERLKEGWLE